MKDITIDPSTMKLELDIMDIPNVCVVVICEGKVKIRELPSHGEYKIITHQGKIKRLRREEGEEF
ncbi:XtrA/YqaO family protein [Domibacillus sp. A3M-37]|uniref:XtrA/YqaO family protein n=1 Tax=Domibacillus sp. A3M-37 TaxID=2962037 RepID=UPI0020B73D2E|nr:XtrA/YqaO family protein [Domibacillus sp. A3M-37]MCP3763880.1 XtrA/YqaO family protein [Domibacillus sp. A3M-37]